MIIYHKKLFHRVNISLLVKLIMAVTLLFCCCCSSIRPNSKNIAEQQNGTLENQNLSSQKNDQSLPRILRENFKISKAWQQFTQDGRYRLANANDFRIPEWAIKASSLEPIQYEVPFLTTQFGHAAIVVDTTQNDESRFGLVILNIDEGTEIKEGNFIHWLYRDKDLSRAVIGGASGGLYVVEYKENGTMVTCFVDWEERQQKYICKNTYVNKIN